MRRPAAVARRDQGPERWRDAPGPACLAADRSCSGAPTAGFGAVYLAQRTRLAGKAVIKVLRSRLADSGMFVQRFQLEAAVLESLDHHHLVRLFNFGELENGRLFLVMEYGGDKTLADEIESS